MAGMEMASNMSDVILGKPSARPCHTERRVKDG